MGGGGTSGSKGQNGLGTLSLAPLIAGQAFGYDVKNAPGGGLTLARPQGGGQLFPQLFSGNQFSSLSNLAQPYQSFLNPGTAQTIGQQASNTLTNTLPAINHLATTA